MTDTLQEKYSLGTEPELTDEDIIDAMQHIPGYLDISTEDFRVIYHLAWRHAVARLQKRHKDDAP